MIRFAERYEEDMTGTARRHNATGKYPDMSERRMVWFGIDNFSRFSRHVYIGSERIATVTEVSSNGMQEYDNDDLYKAGIRCINNSDYDSLLAVQSSMVAAYSDSLRVPYSGSPEAVRSARSLGITGGLGVGHGNGSGDNADNSRTAANDSVFYYHRDHLGSTMAVTDQSGNIVQQVEYTPWGEVFLEKRNGSYFYSPYLFNGKELDEETGLYYYGARYYDPRLSVWYSTDPMQEKYPWVTTYGYCMNNPVKFKEPFGEEPVYDKRGKFLGATSEGFKGDILIYSGRNNINFGKMTRKELFEQYRDYIETLDMELSFAAGGIDKKYLPKIWTHIVSHFEGLQVYDEKFTLSSIANGRIYYNPQLLNDPWKTVFSPDDPSFSPAIFGSGNNFCIYENTVENIASSIIVHEWYSHGMKHTSDKNNSHRLAYKNVINYKYLWNKTTDKYKYFNLYNLWYYTNKETGRNKVDPQYRNLYRKYVGK